MVVYYALISEKKTTSFKNILEGLMKREFSSLSERVFCQLLSLAPSIKASRNGSDIIITAELG